MYNVLREQIMTGKLTPGKPINIKDVQRNYGVALSAVREALCQLAADGLVIAEDQRGFRAAPISKRDLLDLTRARIEIESFALRDAIANGDIQWEANILAEFHKLSQMRSRDSTNSRLITDAYRAQHKAFHQALIAACSSRWMMQFCSTLFEHSERYRQVVVAYNDQPRNIVEEHRALMNAALERNADLAAELIAEHVNRTAHLLLQLGVTDNEG